MSHYVFSFISFSFICNVCNVWMLYKREEEKKIITYISHRMNHNFKSQLAHIYHSYINITQSQHSHTISIQI